MNYAKVFICDIANGPGCRTSLFVSGCRRHCKGCHNEQAWDFGYGQPYTQETKNDILSSLNHNYVQGLSVLGGEPFEPENEPDLIDLVRTVKMLMPDKDIWVWSGYKYEEIKNHPLLEYCDFLVDGPYVEKQRDITLLFRGSRNQRIINLKAWKNY